MTVGSDSRRVRMRRVERLAEDAICRVLGAAAAAAVQLVVVGDDLWQRAGVRRFHPVTPATAGHRQVVANPAIARWRGRVKVQLRPVTELFTAERVVLVVLVHCSYKQQNNDQNYC